MGLGLGDGQSPLSQYEPLVGHALDLGITHFDISADAGSSPDRYTEIGCSLRPWLDWRDEMVISVRVGLGCGPQPLTGFGARKQILSSLNGILRRTGLEYVDVLYAHHLDCGTPLEESTGALASAVHCGKALYVGLSSFPVQAVRHASVLLSSQGAAPVAYQGAYSLADRWAEDGVFNTLQDLGMGFVACAPMARGRLATRPALRRLAHARGQSAEQVALAWCLRKPIVASAVTTTSQLPHLMSDHAAVNGPRLSPDDLTDLDLCCPATDRADSVPGMI
ncbi:aldo/keto reductase [Streptomyces sp. YIM 121038]|uniref:aldo/keto reductase n=1 Tax=Streptomyces sp. YIM 121038 TaxID=2136401 RepID=UPI0014862375|nr:aldo/keto reductase [Streptomyces sp. YIM 121038]